MRSKGNFFKVIDELRHDTGHIYDLITTRQCKTLFNMWQLKTRVKDFKQSALTYLRWHD